jgi:hypothetical protein
MKTGSVGLGFCLLATLTLPLLGDTTTYYIIEENEVLTTTIPGATVGHLSGNPDWWGIVLAAGWPSAGQDITLEPPGETGFNYTVANDFFSGAFQNIFVASDSTFTQGRPIIPTQDATVTDPNGGVHSVVLIDRVPDSSSTALLLAIPLFGMLAIASKRDL